MQTALGCRAVFAMAVLACPGCVIETNRAPTVRGLDRLSLNDSPSASTPSEAPSQPPGTDVLRDGHVSRRELLLRLGHPSRSWASGRYMLFTCNKVSGAISVFISPFYGGPTINNGDKHILLAEFDDSGILTRHQFDKTTLVAGPERMMELCDEFERSAR